jgi:glycosyltransferase involved in cell wall biosynthesis
MPTAFANPVLVSCLCPTYGRAPERLWLLEEAVESFLRQDFPAAGRELVILNDHPLQLLACDAPGVRVVNATNRYPSLGAKMNALVALAQGDVLMPWEDDDVSLPGRITQAYDRICASRTITAYFNPQRSYFFAKAAAGPEGAGWHTTHPHGVCHNASAFTRRAWEAVGGYADTSKGHDTDMDRRLKACPAVAVMPRLPDDPDEWTFVYRWGVSDFHLSGQHDMERAYREYGERPVEPGTFVIRPHWREDYAALARGAAARHPRPA